jgi:hypothetical protein
VLTIRGGNDVVAEEVGEDLTELDLEVGRGGSGGGGGGGGGGDELSKLGDEGGAAAHPLSPCRVQLRPSPSSSFLLCGLS